ncbi:hypothetical protein SRHO_G00080560 [Serrasalmus rhombeus]
MYVVIGSDEEGLLVGEIKLILVHCDSQVYFVVERRQAVQLVHLGVYSLEVAAETSTNHVFYCSGDKTGNLISTTKLARTNPTGETGPGETSSLLEKLVSTGVECKSDLKLIKDEDLQELLRPIQCHKLLQAWSTEEEEKLVDLLICVTSALRSSFPSKLAGTAWWKKPIRLLMSGAESPLEAWPHSLSSILAGKVTEATCLQGDSEDSDVEKYKGLEDPACPDGTTDSTPTRAKEWKKLRTRISSFLRRVFCFGCLPSQCVVPL